MHIILSYMLNIYFSGILDTSGILPLAKAHG